MRNDDLSVARAIALLVPLSLLGGALGSQFIGHLIPCEMCIWQRWPHLVAIIAALLSFVIPTRPLKTSLVLIAGLAIATSGGIGIFHAGVEYHWWQGITACTAPLDPNGDVLYEILHRPLVRCDLAQWSLFGVSLAGFNALLSLAGALAVFVSLAWRPRG
jgi:disulfide bond formation protein DsbB